MMDEETREKWVKTWRERSKSGGKLPCWVRDYLAGKDRWELNEFLNDPKVQDFIDGLFACKHVTRITVLGSMVQKGYEPFNKYVGTTRQPDVDIGVEYDIPYVHKHGSYATLEIKEYFERFDWNGSSVIVSRYRIHIETAPRKKHIVLRER